MAENRQLANVKSAKNDEFYFKFRNVLYSSGWAGWGFESNVTAQAVNSASPETLRDSPIFEHDPDEMFSATITTNMQNSILAKGIPALSSATGVASNLGSSGNSGVIVSFPMSKKPKLPWCRSSSIWGNRWLHTDLHNIAYFFTSHIFDLFVSEGEMDE